MKKAKPKKLIIINYRAHPPNHDKRRRLIIRTDVKQEGYPSCYETVSIVPEIEIESDIGDTCGFMKNTGADEEEILAVLTKYVDKLLPEGAHDIGEVATMKRSS